MKSTIFEMYYFWNALYFSTWLIEGPKPQVQDKKMVSIRPTASTGRVDYVGGAIAAADLAIIA